ncbi:MAG: choice-of-anchor tandem repeat GloVer-containing protein [Candidatus Cybelea sp.]
MRHGYCVFRSPFWGPAFSSHLGGAFYGTTSDVAYRVTTTGKEMSLHAFGSGHDGATTVQSPMAVLNRKFYGATQLGGSKRCNSGCGTIFGLTTGGAENVVYPFQGGHDGFVPLGSVIEVKGALYGTTSYGGADDGGTVFKMTGSGTKSILYSFKVAGNDGERPSGNVTDVGGVLYGTTAFGGAKDLGTIFTLNASRKETVLHAFAGGTDGASPNGSLVAVKVSCMARRPVAVNLGKEQSFR